MVGNVGGKGLHRDLNEDETEAVGECYAAQRLHSKVPLESCKATSCAGFVLLLCCMLQVLEVLAPSTRQLHGRVLQRECGACRAWKSPQVF